MPFWKKSEDPWDMEPRKTCRDDTKEIENPTKESKNRNEQRKDAAETEEQSSAMICPWCGMPMERGYLDAVKGGNIWWVKKRPDLKSSMIGADPKTSLLVDDEGTLWTYKTAWYCAACKKMALDAAGMKEPYATNFDTLAEREAADRQQTAGRQIDQAMQG